MSSQPEFNFTSIPSVLTESVDICANRHRGNVQSIKAHESIVEHKAKTFKKILEFVGSQGLDGATSKEISRALGRPLNCLSGRFSDLKRMKRLRGTGETREGAEVLKLV